MSKRTLRCLPIQSSRVVIGVDIAKNLSLAVAQGGDGTLAKPLSFETSEQGFLRLLAYAEALVDKAGAEGFVVALEPTGHYGWPLVCWLRKRGIEVFRIEPLHTNRLKELYDGTRRKTDAKDAVIIASLCRQGLCQPWQVLTGPFADLRLLSRRREQLVQQQSAAANRLHQHLDMVFPELRGLFAKVTCATVLTLLSQVQTPAQILALSEEELADLLWRASRGQLGVDRARAVREAAARTVGSPEGQLGHRVALRQAVEELAHVHKLLVEVERHMRQQLNAVPYAQHLLSVPRLGAITVATLLGEFGDLRNYQRAAQLIKMAGLDLVEVSSGQKRGKRFISRKGRAYARQILYLAALRLGGGVLAEPRRRMVEESKLEPTKAAVANMCRLLRILHALVRDEVAFEAGRYEVATAA